MFQYLQNIRTALSIWEKMATAPNRMRKTKLKIFGASIADQGCPIKNANRQDA